MQCFKRWNSNYFLILKCPCCCHRNSFFPNCSVILAVTFTLPAVTRLKVHLASSVMILLKAICMPQGTVCVSQNENQNTFPRELCPSTKLFGKPKLFGVTVFPPYNLLFQPSNFSKIVCLGLMCCIPVSISIVTEHKFVVIQ